MGPDNRPLDLEWLEDFVSLAETGNFSRAAEARAIAQPAFSRHIRSLEEWVGVDLFDRGAHPVELNDAGRRFLPLVREILAGLEAARIKARLAQDQSAASLRFAVTHALSVTFFPRWFAEIGASLRHGPVQTLSDHSRACEDLMAQRRVQFVLCYGHADVPGRLDEGGYPMARLATDVVVPVSAPGRPKREHRSAQHEGTLTSATDDSGGARFQLGRDALLPLLDYSDASGLGRMLRARLASRLAQSGAGEGGPGASVVFTAHNALLLKAMALAGRGIAWVPQSLAAAELAAGALALAGDAAWHLPVEVRLYRQKAEMAPTAEALWRLAKSGSDT